MKDKKAKNEPDMVYHTDRWTRYLWQQHVDSSGTVQDILEQGSEKIYSFPGFAREVFHRLYADKAERLDVIRPEHAWALDTHQELDQLPAFNHLKQRCSGDKFLSRVAATAFSEKVMGNLPSPPVPLEDPEPLREQVKGLLNFAKHLAEQGETARAEEVNGLIEQIRDQGLQAVQAADKYAASLDPSDVRNTLRSAIEQANTQVDEAVEQWSAFAEWGTGAGTEGRGASAEVKAELARRIQGSEKLRRLAKEAGRLRRIAAAKQRSKADHARDEVTDIEMGADLDRLLPSELVKLCDPAMALDFARKFHERGLLQYKLSGKESQGRGPIVICLDSSSSMRGAKEIWSKAFALALLQIATQQKRLCRVVHFNGSVVRVDDWKPGKLEPLALLESMEQFWGGGTNFQKPLNTALEAIQQQEKLKKADVVLVTDGECDVSEHFAEEWKKAKLKHEFTTYAVHIDAPGGIPPPVLSKVADKVIGLADLADDRQATEVLTI